VYYLTTLSERVYRVGDKRKKEIWIIVTMVLAGEITGIRENSVPVSLYPPQIPHELALAI
jgi:hypothetical protein